MKIRPYHYRKVKPRKMSDIIPPVIFFSERYEITALTNVVLEYCPALETGSCDDMEATYDAFINKLEASGAQDLLTAYQEQYALCSEVAANTCCLRRKNVIQE